MFTFKHYYRKIKTLFKELYGLAPVSKRGLLVLWSQNWQLVISRIFLIVTEVASNIATLFFSGRLVQFLVDYLASNSTDKSAAIAPLAMVVAARLVNQISNQLIGYNGQSIWWTIKEHVVVEFNKKSAELSFEQHENPEFTAIKDRLWSEYEYKPSNFIQDIFGFIHAFFGIAGVAVTLAFLNIYLVLIVPLIVVPALIYEASVAKVRWGTWSEKGDLHYLWWRSTWYLTEENKLLETKVFGTKGYMLRIVKSNLAKLHKSERTKYLKLQPLGVFSRVVSVFSLGLIELWLVFKVIARRGFEIGDFSFYTGAVFSYNSSMSVLVQTTSNLFDSSLYMKDMFDYLDTEPLIEVADNPVKISKNKIPLIEFRNVSFKYPGSKEYIFEDLNIVINPKDKIAFVGENGAGKTTLIKLLLRFYDVTSGEITVNGHNVKDLDIDSYYRHIGVLFQDFNDYPYQVKDNIGLGKPNSTNNLKDIKVAASLAGADKFIEKYPKKYNQYLEANFKDGIKPSGGQWQRIALARAFFRNASILILDEPTAAVDANAEYEIFENIEKTQKDKTTIIISHRFSTVRNADIIYVINKGKIIEQGSHKQLMKNRSLYEEMFSKQAQGYR